MLHVLTIVLPVFGLIALGFAARLSGLVGDRTGEGLSDFVFAIAVPALVFKTLTAAAIPASQPWGYWFAYFISVAIVWALGTWSPGGISGSTRSPASSRASAPRRPIRYSLASP